MLRTVRYNSDKEIIGLDYLSIDPVATRKQAEKNVDTKLIDAYKAAVNKHRKAHCDNKPIKTVKKLASEVRKAHQKILQFIADYSKDNPVHFYERANEKIVSDKEYARIKKKLNNGEKVTVK